MTISLQHEITEKDRENYIKIQVQRSLCLPFSPKIFADIRFWVEQLNGDDRKSLESKIWRWFYEHGFNGSRIKSGDSKLSGHRKKDAIGKEIS